MCNVDFGKQFDVMLMMFAILGYQLTNEDVMAALCTVQQYLRLGRLFL